MAAAGHSLGSSTQGLRAQQSLKAPLGEAKPAEGKAPAPQHCLGLGVREGLHGRAHAAPRGKQGLPAGFCIFI